MCFLKKIVKNFLKIFSKKPPFSSHFRKIGAFLWLTTLDGTSTTRDFRRHFFFGLQWCQNPIFCSERDSRTTKEQRYPQDFAMYVPMYTTLVTRWCILFHQLAQWEPVAHNATTNIHVGHYNRTAAPMPTCDSCTTVARPFAPLSSGTSDSGVNIHMFISPQL